MLFLALPSLPLPVKDSYPHKSQLVTHQQELLLLIFHKANNSYVILLMVLLIISSEFSNKPQSQNEQWEKKKKSNRSSREEDDRQGKRITEPTNIDAKMRIISPVSECRFVKSFTSQISAEGSLITPLVLLL